MSNKKSKFTNKKPDGGKRNERKNTDDYKRDPKRSQSGTDNRRADTGSNDSSWYNAYPDLLRAASNFPFPNKPGMSVHLGNVSETDTTTVGPSIDYQIPGLMCCEWVPSVGISNDVNSPISVAAKEIYSRVRAAFSGSLVADAPDYIVYIMALDSIFSYIAWLKRLYCTLNAWSPENMLLPDILLNGMGFFGPDIVKLRQEKVELGQYINTLVYESRKFTCPALMHVLNRHLWMSENVYTDYASVNAQMYMFNPRALYYYSSLPIPGNETDNAGGLTLVRLPHSESGKTITAKTLYDYGNAAIQALVSWDDAYTINGYLKRAYEGVPQFQVEPLTFAEVLSPVYNPEVLLQIENSRCALAFSDTDNLKGFDVQQQPLTNALISNPHLKISTTAVDAFNVLHNDTYNLKPLLTIEGEVAEPKLIAVATRLTSVVTKVDTKGETATMYYACGTEMALRWRLWNGIGINDIADIPPVIYSTQENPVSFTNIMALDQFFKHPNILVSLNDQGTLPYTFVVGDVHNVTAIEPESLTNLHRVCLYSEFNSFDA